MMNSPLIIWGMAASIFLSGWSPVRAAPGDMNCDGSRNGLDVGPFVLALLNPSAYQAAYSGCSPNNADYDCDGSADVDDISGFVKCLLTDNCPACPPLERMLIPAGEFLMGNSFSGEGAADELPRHAAYVDAFYMDTREVTNQQYVDALNWARSRGVYVSSGVVYYAGVPCCDTTINVPNARITWNGSSFGVVSGKENHPMVWVSWYGAAAYANWRSAMAGKPLCYDSSTWECDFGAAGYQ